MQGAHVSVGLESIDLDSITSRLLSNPIGRQDPASLDEGAADAHDYQTGKVQRSPTGRSLSFDDINWVNGLPICTVPG